jgi:hypothetical protein
VTPVSELSQFKVTQTIYFFNNRVKIREVAVLENWNGRQLI